MNIGMYKKSLDFMGSCVDSVFLSLPHVINFFKKPRNIDQETYGRQIDYYFENGFVDHPERLFTLPDAMPDYRVEFETPFLDGTYQVISFESGYETRNPLIREEYDSYRNNRTGYLIRWTHGDKGRKTLLCLHGYLLGDPQQAQKMFRVEKLFSEGLDVALFITPFHWKRAPEDKTKRGIFLQPEDVVMTLECLAQAMHDLKLVNLILSDVGVSEIGMIGASLGGYLAALYSCLDDHMAFTALIVPAVEFGKPVSPETAKLSFKPDRTMKQKIHTLWTLHSPLNFTPRLSPGKMLVIASRGDLVCPFEYVDKLCRKWNLPQKRFMTGGHWLVFNARARGKAWYSFLNQMRFVTSQ
jgi:hypothetical protein